MRDPQEYVDAGLALIQLGRWRQRHYAKAGHEGSQFDEDQVLQQFLPEKSGIYVDIGANHPKECSNTWRLYERGWRGLLIEPLPDTWGNLLLTRPEDYLCPVAASNTTGFSTLRVARSVSSMRPDWNIGDVESIPIQIDTLKNILSFYPQVDWTKTDLCSIDVEGHEKEVLEGIDWKNFHPRVIVIEYRDYDAEKFGEDNSAQWKDIIQSNGYQMETINPLNQIWRRKK